MGPMSATLRGIAVETFTTPAPIVAVLELAIADVRITAAERADTTVEVRPSDPGSERDVRTAEETRVELSGSQLLVRMPKTRGLTPWGKPGSVGIDIALPAESQLRAKGAVASIHATGPLGDTYVKTATGDVSLEQTAALDVNTAAGSITVERVDGTARLHTSTGTIEAGSLHGDSDLGNANGRTRVRSAAGALKVSNANGDVEIEHAAAAVVATTANGTITVTRAVSGRVEAKTAAGSVRIGVARGTAAHLDLHTAFGKVRTELQDSRAPEPGEESVEIKARTSFGNIDVIRAEPVSVS
jgi:hypothetical protein